MTIFITDNIPVEVSEIFEVQLRSNSDLVVLNDSTRTGTVEIIDDDRESYITKTLVHMQYIALLHSARY